MYEHFLFAFRAVAPIMLYIMLGYCLKSIGIIEKDFFKQCNRFIFHVFLPTTAFTGIYACPSLAELDLPLVGFCSLLVVLLAAVGLVIVHMLIKDPYSYSAAHQTFFRSNAMVLGSALAVSLAGEEGGTLISTILLVLMPIMNVFAVLTLTLHPNHGGGKRTVKGFLISIFTNPLIAACLLGLLMLIIRALLPKNADGEAIFTLKNDLPIIFDVITRIGACSMPLSLIILGGLMDFSNIKGDLGPIVLGLVSKLFFAPFLAVALALAVHHAGLYAFSAPAYATLLALFGSPIAVASGPLTAEMGGDGELAAQYVMWTNLFLMVSMPLEIVVMRSMGLF